MKSVPGGVMRGRGLFPEGTFRGELAKGVNLEENKAGNIQNLNLQLINNELLDGDKEVGRRPFFLRLMTSLTTEVEEKGRKKEKTFVVFDIDPEDESVPFGLRSQIPTFAQLAVALNQATVEPDGGVTFESSLEEFIEQLSNDSYAGETVEFTVSHRTYTRKRDNKDVTIADVVFTLPEPGEEPAADADTMEEEPEQEEETKGSGRKKFARKR